MAWKRLSLLGWAIVLAVGMANDSAQAQYFSAGGGLTAPAALPAPVLNYGGFVPRPYGLGYGWGWTQWMQNPY